MARRKNGPNHAFTLRRAAHIKNILALLAAGPMSNDELGAAMNMSRSGPQRYTDSLLAERKIHIHEWRKPANGPSRRYYALGDKPDAVFVPVRIPSRSQKVIGEENRKRVLTTIATPRMSGEIAVELSISTSSVLRHLEVLRGEGKARIDSWRQLGKGGIAPVYGQGNAPDALRPVTRVRTRRNPDRALADSRNSAVISVERTRASAQETIASARIKPHGFFAALGV